MLRRVLARCYFSTQLMTWGPTTYGWARPITNKLWTPAKADTPDNVASVFTGPTHLGFITSDHAAYVCGLENGFEDTQTPKKLEFEGNPSIVSLSCGTYHSLALTSDGAVFAWGRPVAVPQQSGTPVRMPQELFNGQKVIQVATGENTSFALTENGNVYAWGSGLCNFYDWEASDVDELIKPILCGQITELCQKRHAKVKKIAAVNRFVMVLLDDGRIYCRGTNNGGVFGARQNPLIMSDNVLSRFAKVHDEHYKNERIVDFEVASNSLIFKTESDRIFFNGMFYAWNPTPFPIEVQPKSIFAAEDSVGVVAEDGKIWFVNEKIIDDSELVSQKDRLYVSEDPNLEREIVSLGGKHSLIYALLK